VRRASIFVVPCAFAYLAFGAALADDEKWKRELISWEGSAPDVQHTTHDIECADDFYTIKLVRRKNDSAHLMELIKNSEHLNAALLDEINGVLGDFQHVKGVNFSCGTVFENKKNPELERKDFRGTFSISMIGRSKYETAAAVRRCHDQGHYYDDEVQASVLFRGNEIVKVKKPGVGVCITGIGPAVELRRPQSNDGGKQ
jgi:hypothetical protein